MLKKLAAVPTPSFANMLQLPMKEADGPSDVALHADSDKAEALLLDAGRPHAKSSMVDVAVETELAAH